MVDHTGKVLSEGQPINCLGCLKVITNSMLLYTNTSYNFKEKVLLLRISQEYLILGGPETMTAVGNGGSEAIVDFLWVNYNNRLLNWRLWSLDLLVGLLVNFFFFRVNR